MRPTKPYMLGFWVMVVIVCFRLLLLIGITIFIYSRTSSGNPSFRFNLFMFISLMLLLMETMLYWYRRYHIPNKLWVHIHVWTTFITMVVMPVAVFFLLRILMNMYNQEEYYNLWEKYSRIQSYVFWGLIAIGHIFFIATIVKSLQLQKEPETDEAPGLLDEFVDPH